MENKVSELRGKLAELKALSKMDLAEIPVQTRPGWEARVRNATAQIDSLEDELAQEILAKSVTIVLENGVSQTDDIIKTLKSVEVEGTVIDMDYMQMETSLVNVLFSQVKNGTFPFNGSTVSQLNILLSEIADDIGVIEMPVVNGSGGFYGTLNSKEEAIDRVQKMIESVMDNDFKNIVLKRRIFQTAKTRLNLDRVAVVLYNVPKEYLNSSNLLNTKTAVVSTDETVGDVVLATEDMSPEALLKAVVEKISGKKRKKVATQNEQ